MDIKHLNQQLNQFLEMSPNLRHKDTNLPMLIYVSTQEGQHGPRIKFLNKKSQTNWTNADSISVSIEDNPRIVFPKDKVSLKISNKDFKHLQQWIIQNKECLLDFWFLRITRDELSQRLTKFVD